MPTELDAWLESAVEDAIEPDLPVCDPHHHLWDRPDYRYVLEDWIQDAGSGHNIVQTVFLECSAMYRKDGPREMQPVGETEFVQEIADRSASGRYGMTGVAAGIVGFADLTLGAAVAPVLEAHIAASPNRFRGIRHASAWNSSLGRPSHKNPPEGLLLDSTFREGFACLQNTGLSFDAWFFHTQVADLVDLAGAFPDVSIIMDHIGGPLGTGPYEREGVFQEWKRGIVQVAGCPNVVVKLGGLGMPLCGFDWHERATPPGSVELADAMGPYTRWCIEQFGVDRCMFESNFPVDKVSYSYTVLWNAFKRITEDLSPEDRAALFHDTAVRVYRLA